MLKNIYIVKNLIAVLRWKARGGYLLLHNKMQQLSVCVVWNQQMT